MTLDAVHTALIARIAAINGTGGFTFNFSATGVVTRALPSPGSCDTMPRVHVSYAGRPLTDAPEMTSWEIREHFDIAAYVPPGVVSATVDDADGRIRSAEVALEDLENAIIADRRLGGTALDCRILAVSAIDGASIANIGGTSVGVAFLLVETMRYKQGVP